MCQTFDHVWVYSSLTWHLVQDYTDAAADDNMKWLASQGITL